MGGLVSSEGPGLLKGLGLRARTSDGGGVNPEAPGRGRSKSLDKGGYRPSEGPGADPG